jgi:hypothetical protein
MTSSAREMKNTARTVIMMNAPGGMFHHQAVRQAPDRRALWRMPPHEIDWGGPEAEERQRRLGDDRRAEDDGELEEHQRQHVRRDVQVEDAHVGGAGDAGGLDERPLGERQHLRADQPGDRPPGEQRDRQDDDHQAGIEEQHQDHREGLEGDAVHHVDDAHQHGVGAAAEVAGEEADVGADQHDQRGAEEAHQQRDARAVHVLAVEVATEVVGAEPVLGGGRRQLVDERVGADGDGSALDGDDGAEVALGAGRVALPGAAVERQRDAVAADGPGVAVGADPGAAQRAGVGRRVLHPAGVRALAAQQRAALADDQGAAALCVDVQAVEVAEGRQRQLREAARPAAVGRRPAQREAALADGDGAAVDVRRHGAQLEAAADRARHPRGELVERLDAGREGAQREVPHGLAGADDQRGVAGVDDGHAEQVRVAEPHGAGRVALEPDDGAALAHRDGAAGRQRDGAQRRRRHRGQRGPRFGEPPQRLAVRAHRQRLAGADGQGVQRVGPDGGAHAPAAVVEGHPGALGALDDGVRVVRRDPRGGQRHHDDQAQDGDAGGRQPVVEDEAQRHQNACAR